jgi:anti-sigma-K factor RskA
MEHDDLLDLVVPYAFGVLDAAERRAFETHLADGCDECAAALREALAVADQLALAAPRIDPPARVLDAIRARIAEPTAAAPQATRIRWMPLALAASLAAATLLGVQAWRAFDALDATRAERVATESRLAELQAELDRARAESGEASARAERLAGLVRVLTARDTRSIALVGQEAAANASARAYLSPSDRQLLLYVYDLPPTPPGSTYQLWVILEGKPPISAGTFEIDAEGRARHEALAPPEVTGPVTIAVSVEPSGGVPAPTGPIVLAGN